MIRVQVISTVWNSWRQEQNNCPGLTGIGQVYAGIVNLNNAVSGVNTEGTLQNGTAALKAGIKQIQDQVSALQNTTSAEGLKKLSAGLSSAKTGMENASAASTKAAEISGQVESSIEHCLDSYLLHGKLHGCGKCSCCRWKQ